MFTVIFDLDGTLTRKDTYFPFLLSCIGRFGLSKHSIWRIPFYTSLFLCGRITRTRLKEIFLDSVLAGVTLNKLKPLTERYISDLLERKMNHPVIQRLRSHLERHDRVILATASFDLYVNELAERLKIPHVVCTRAEVDEGVVTGRIDGENCRGEEKVRRLEGLLSPSDWSSSIFYTDHLSDLPLLKKVKEGVLVNPSIKTRAALRDYHFPLFPNA